MRSIFGCWGWTVSAVYFWLLGLGGECGLFLGLDGECGLFLAVGWAWSIFVKSSAATIPKTPWVLTTIHRGVMSFLFIIVQSTEEITTPPQLHRPHVNVARTRGNGSRRIFLRETTGTSASVDYSTDILGTHDVHRCDKKARVAIHVGPFRIQDNVLLSPCFFRVNRPNDSGPKRRV